MPDLEDITLDEDATVSPTPPDPAVDTATMPDLTVPKPTSTTNDPHVGETLVPTAPVTAAHTVPGSNEQAADVHCQLCSSLATTKVHIARTGRTRLRCQTCGHVWKTA